jgi:hypothetical protein
MVEGQTWVEFGFFWLGLFGFKEWSNKGWVDMVKSSRLG